MHLLHECLFYCGCYHCTGGVARRPPLTACLTLCPQIFDSELEALEEQVKAIARAGVDAVIVQDIGAVDIVRRAAPNLPVSAAQDAATARPWP